jgi:phosphohistidine phosphatase
MQLLVIRHAIAEDREEFAASGRDDAERPLTAEGARKMRRTARGLHEIVPMIDVLAASPLVRANETADIVRREYEIDCIETADVLKPDVALEDVVSWMAKYTAGVVAIVGHEPQLGRLVTYLVSGVDNGGVELKKGGASMIEFDGKPVQGGGRLRWSIPPGLLRDFAG